MCYWSSEVRGRRNFASTLVYRGVHFPDLVPGFWRWRQSYTLYTELVRVLNQSTHHGRATEVEVYRNGDTWSQISDARQSWADLERKQRRVHKEWSD
jgi:hypothetical protein